MYSGVESFRTGRRWKIHFTVLGQMVPAKSLHVCPAFCSSRYASQNDTLISGPGCLVPRKCERLQKERKRTTCDVCEKQFVVKLAIFCWSPAPREQRAPSVVVTVLPVCCVCRLGWLVDTYGPRVSKWAGARWANCREGCIYKWCLPCCDMGSG